METEESIVKLWVAGVKVDVLRKLLPFWFTQLNQRYIGVLRSYSTANAIQITAPFQIGFP